MEPSEEYSREDIRKLTAALTELYYIILSLNPIVHENTRILAKGFEIKLPLDLIRTTLLVRKLAEILKEIWKAIYMPSRMLIEELRISNTVEGRIDVPLTSRLIGQGQLLIASRKRRLSLEAIENIFLKAFLKRLEKDAEKFLDSVGNVRCGDIVYEEVFKAFTENVREKLLTIRKNIRELEKKTFLKHIDVRENLVEDRGLERLAWKVLERNMYPYNSIARWTLKYVKTNMLALLTKYIKGAKEISDLKLGLWDYKLYEVYTYYVVTYLVAKTFNIQSIVMWKDEVLLSSRKVEVKISYDKTPECKSWIAHGKHYVLNHDKIKVPPGRPDITVYINEQVSSVCDAKYRVSTKELSESRFKVLGYMHEYSAPIGVLFFDPNHVKNSSSIDKEVEETIEFINKAVNYGGIIVEDENKALHIIALEPKPFAKLRESREYRVLEKTVEKLITKEA